MNYFQTIILIIFTVIYELQKKQKMLFMQFMGVLLLHITKTKINAQHYTAY